MWSSSFGVRQSETNESRQGNDSSSNSNNNNGSIVMLAAAPIALATAANILDEMRAKEKERLFQDRPVSKETKAICSIPKSQRFQLVPSLCK